MQGEGIVTKANGDTATVKVRKSSSCGHDCGECRLCNNPEIEVQVVNEKHAKAGDRVLIGAPTSTVLFQAFLLYIVPIIGSMAVYATVSAFKVRTPAVVIAVLVYLAVWFAFTRYWSKYKIKESCVLEVIHGKEN